MQKNIGNVLLERSAIDIYQYWTLDLKYWNYYFYSYYFPATSVYGIRRIDLDVLNKNTDAINLKYNTKSYSEDEKKIIQKETIDNINGYTNPIITLNYPMYAENERLSLTTDKLFDINGQGSVFNILFSQDVYAMVVLSKKRKSYKDKTVVL